MDKAYDIDYASLSNRLAAPDLSDSDKNAIIDECFRPTNGVSPPGGGGETSTSKGTSKGKDKNKGKSPQESAKDSKGGNGGKQSKSQRKGKGKGATGRGGKSK